MGVRFDGEFYRINIPAFFLPFAVRDRIPFYLAAVQKGMFRTTGETADGLVGHPLYTRKYIASILNQIWKLGRKEQGAGEEYRTLPSLLFTAISHDRSKAIQ